MYKLIIADDENIIRSGLKNILNWEELGFEVVGIFGDGEEVLDYLDYTVPDVILTDVKMSNVSGLEVAKYVMEHQCACKVVLVSGFHEFDLALKALKYGADEYLLKPVDPDELERVFLKIKKELDKKSELATKTYRDQLLMKELQIILEKQLLEEIVLGAAKGEEYLRNHFQMIYPGLNLDFAQCFLMELEISRYDWFIEKVWGSGYDNFEAELDSFLRNFEGDYMYRIAYKNADIVCILAIERYETELQYHYVVQELLKTLCETFRFEAKHHIHEVYPNLWSLAVQRSKKEMLRTEGFKQAQFNEQLMLMLSNTVTGNYIRAQDLFRSILNKLVDLPMIERNRAVWQVLNKIMLALKDSDPGLYRGIVGYFQEQDLMCIAEINQLQEYCDRVFDYIRMEHAEESSNVNELVQRAKQYICENIFRDVSREEVAGKLYISSSYLSKLFVKETGESYLSFVNAMKVEKAKELLRDNENRSYQIGEMLGYSTPKYFTKLFKSQTGMTPSEYRKKVLRTEGNTNE